MSTSCPVSVDVHHGPPQWLADALHDAYVEAPRTQQRNLGPSEVGSPCQRKVALKVVHAEWFPLPVNAPVFSQASYVGTAVHAALAAHVQRWDIDTEVHVIVDTLNDDNLFAGTADVIITRGDTHDVVDFKVVRGATLSRARRGDVDPAYLTQVNLYALGVERSGHDVGTCSIVYVPAAGELSDTVTVSWTYDSAVAERALAAYHGIRRAVARRATREAMSIEGVLDIARATTTAADHCHTCPFLDVKVAGETLCRGEWTSHEQVKEELRPILTK